jgi:flagellin-like protein
MTKNKVVKHGRKGIDAVVAVILLLLMTIAAAGAAYLWITRLSTMVQTTAQESFLEQQRKQGTRYSLDSIWNVTTDLVFTVRNTGSYDIPGADFDKSTMFINNIGFPFGPAGMAGKTCTYAPADLAAMGGSFTSDSAITVTCVGGYPVSCSSSGCAKVVVKANPPYGFFDSMSYQAS